MAEIKEKNRLQKKRCVNMMTLCSWAEGQLPAAENMSTWSPMGRRVGDEKYLKDNARIKNVQNCELTDLRSSMNPNKSNYTQRRHGQNS